MAGASDGLLAHLRHLVGDAAEGGPLAQGVRVRGLSAELGWLVELDVDGRPLTVEIVPISAARGHKVLTVRYALGYRTPTAIDPLRALAATHALAGIVARHETDDAVAAPTATQRIRELTSDGEALVPVEGPPAYYALNPYVGCTIGCRFCYAQSRLQPLRARAGAQEAPWGSWIDARVDLPARLAVELATRSPRPIKFSPIVGDPYPAIERRLRITRGCLAAITAAPPGWTALVLTRSASAEDDLELLARTGRIGLGVSLPTIDDAVRAHFEPRAATVEERLELLARARSLGIPTFAVVQPLLPGDLEALADALARTTVLGVSIDVLRGEEAAGPLFDDPAFASARSSAWQDERAAALREHLLARGTPTWRELPEELG